MATPKDKLNPPSHPTSNAMVDENAPFLAKSMNTLNENEFSQSAVAVTGMVSYMGGILRILSVATAIDNAEKLK